MGGRVCGFLAARGITTGVGGGKYGAGDQIKRADFVTMLARVAGVDTSKYSATFDDVDRAPITQVLSDGQRRQA